MPERVAFSTRNFVPSLGIDEDIATGSIQAFLNPYWTQQHGGELRLWLPDGVQRYVDIQPLAGRLVIFLSGLVEHQVQPSFHDRVALTAWLH